jgi:hypothetical protein
MDGVDPSALAALREDRNDWCVFVVGTASVRIQALARTLGLDDSVEFIALIPMRAS